MPASRSRSSRRPSRVNAPAKPSPSGDETLIRAAGSSPTSSTPSIVPSAFVPHSSASPAFAGLDGVSRGCSEEMTIADPLGKQADSGAFPWVRIPPSPLDSRCEFALLGCCRKAPPQRPFVAGRRSHRQRDPELADLGAGRLPRNRRVEVHDVAGRAVRDPSESVGSCAVATGERDERPPSVVLPSTARPHVSLERRRRACRRGKRRLRCRRVLGLQPSDHRILVLELPPKVASAPGGPRRNWRNTRESIGDPFKTSSAPVPTSRWRRW